MSYTVLVFEKVPILNLIVAHCEELPPRYQKVREAVARAMGLCPDLTLIDLTRRCCIFFKVVYLSPLVTTFEEIFYHLMIELHDEELFQAPNNHLMMARAKMRSIFLAEGCPSKCFDKVSNKDRELFCRYYVNRHQKLDPQLQSSLAYNGWDSEWTVAFEGVIKHYELHNLKERNNPKDHQRIRELEQRLAVIDRPEYLQQSTPKNFPKRTEAMCGTLQEAESVRREVNLPPLFLIAGLRHLLVNREITNPIWDISKLYEVLCKLLAIVVYPAEAEKRVVEYDNPELYNRWK